MALADAARGAVVVFLAAMLQVTVFATLDVAGGTPDLLLVTLVAVALLRGPVFGASAGFFGGLIADTATLATLGLTSLLLTLAGYWIGRFAESAGRERAHVPVLAVSVATVLYAAAAVGLHFVLGRDVAVSAALGTGLVAAVVWNAVLAAPVYAACRRLLPPPELARAREVGLLG